MSARPGRILVIEHEPDATLDLMSRVLDDRVADVVRPYLGESLPALDDRPGLVVLGGEMGAWDDVVAPWLPATRRLLADAVRRQVPTLGICLGAQLLAAACGGTVERGGAGLELGLVAVRAVPAAGGDPLVGSLTEELDVAPWQVSQYHYDAVTHLPPDAELLLTGDRYAHQGFRVGPAAWGLQYHPEVSTECFARWVANAQQSGELAGDADALVAEVRAAAAGQLRLAGAHSRAFLAVAHPAMRTTLDA